MMAEQSTIAGTEEDVLLPAKISNHRRVRSVQDVNVLINAFSLDLSRAHDIVYQFELKFVGEKPLMRRMATAEGAGSSQEGQPVYQTKELHKGPRNDEINETRRRVCWALFQQLIENNQDFFGKNKRLFVYDCSTLMFSALNLGLSPKESGTNFVVEFNRDRLEERCRSYLKNFTVIRANLMLTDQIGLKNAARAYVEGDRRIVHFLELLSSQWLYHRGTHYIFGNRMYEANSVDPLTGDPRILKSGQQKNVRIVGDDEPSARPILQLDPKKSAFFPNMELLRFLLEFLGVQERHADEITKNLDKCNKQVIGLSVVTTHLPNNQMTFAIFELTHLSANELTFIGPDGKQISVSQYFLKKYKQKLKYAHLPCAIQKVGPTGSGRTSYYPIELLIILPGQRVPVEKQTPKLTQNMITKCQVLPIKMGGQIDEQRNMAMIQSGNPFFQNFGVRLVDTNLAVAHSEVLFPPAIQYAGLNRIEPNDGGVLKWKMFGSDAPRNLTYTLPVDFPKKWAAVIVQNAVSNGACWSFIEQLRNTGRSRGITNFEMPQQVDEFVETTQEYVHKKMSLYAEQKCTIVLFIAHGKRNAFFGDIHHVMKQMEQRTGVLTLHISQDMVNKSGPMVLENICLKLNLKLGGANYDLLAAHAFKRVNGGIQKDLLVEWFDKRRIFLGLDMSHAPSQTRHDRANRKLPAVPTIVGLAYTIGQQMLRIRGTYWAQQCRVSTVQQVRPLINSVKEALCNYQRHCGHFPEHLILYRGGASEGEFKRVNFAEGGAIVKACQELHDQMSVFKKGLPALTIVVCQRQSNYRMIPQTIDQKMSAPGQNVQPGTVLDRALMNPTLTEFLLVSHKALQGTAQPVRCTVVMDSADPRMPLEELENMTNALCYSHGICCSPTAVPGVLYSAAELAKRGRNNWKMHTFDGSAVEKFDLPPLGADPQTVEQAQHELDNRRAVYFEQISAELKPGIQTKFWA